jgi:tRNA(Glu) U13 pseudouridine synthase TruD
MPSYVELPDFGEDIDVSYDEIAAETDTALLHRYYEQLEQEALEMSSFIEAFRLAAVEDDKWFKGIGGKYAYNRIASRWIERRLLALGEKVNYPPTDPRSRELRILSQKVADLKRRVEELEKDIVE